MNLNHEKEQRIQRMIRKKRKKWKNKSGTDSLHKITWIGTKKNRDIEGILIIHEYFYFNSEFLVTLTE